MAAQLKIGVVQPVLTELRAVTARGTHEPSAESQVYSIVEPVPSANFPCETKMPYNSVVELLVNRMLQLNKQHENQNYGMVFK